MKKSEIYRRINPILYIVIVFIVSRTIYLFIGVRYEVELGLCQYIDPLLLRNNLFQSIYYLHSQPPLFNLFIGLILKLFPEPAEKRNGPRGNGKQER